jgi:hypothetical protein
MANEGLKPFVILIEGEHCGRPIAIIAGVELGISDDDAFHKAIWRFPPSRYLVLPPLPWEEADPEVRLAAIDADRMGIF